MSDPQNLTAVGLHLGLGTVKGAATLGIRTVGLKTVCLLCFFPLFLQHSYFPLFSFALFNIIFKYCLFLGCFSLYIRQLRFVLILKVSMSEAVLRGAARGAVGIGIVIDGVTIAITASSLAKGETSKLSEELRKIADIKSEELVMIRNRIRGASLINFIDA